jgi:Fe2+ or Zn2+ uptake regulation protein
MTRPGPCGLPPCAGRGHRITTARRLLLAVLAEDRGHLACQACGQITEIPGQLLDSLARALRNRYGFTVSQHHVAITGCCARCH